MKDLDCRGMRCPLPIIKLARELKTIGLGEAIRLLSDDPATLTDLQAWARMTGNYIQTKGDAEFLVTKAKVD